MTDFTNHATNTEKVQEITGKEEGKLKAYKVSSGERNCFNCGYPDHFKSGKSEVQKDWSLGEVLSKGFVR